MEVSLWKLMAGINSGLSQNMAQLIKRYSRQMGFTTDSGININRFL